MSLFKEITIYDLAESLNLSVATVSRALKDDPLVTRKTKKKVIDLAEKMNYRANQFARNLRNKKTNSIGIIVPRLSSYFMATVIAGVESIANKNGYNLIISQSSEVAEKEKLSVKTMFNNRVDGLLVSLANDTTDSSSFNVFLEQKVPLIFFDRIPDDKSYSCVVIDNRKASYEATKHLLDQGCKRIVYITAKFNRNVYVDRFQGYKDALAEYGITYKEEDIIINDISEEEGVKAAEIIKKMNPLPDAVFVVNDNCAVGCMIALKKAGFRIPEDIAFVGFNNDPVSHVVEPNLTTINYPGYEMGEVAAHSLISRLNGSVSIISNNTIILHSGLVVRASSLKNKNK